MALHIVPWYAAILALIYVGLSLRVIQGRGKYSVNLGSGHVDDLERRVRAHANFAEYVPLTLLLIMMEELVGLWPWSIHMLCMCLVLGRLAHAWGISGSETPALFRVGGMALTLTALAFAALLIPVVLRS